MGKVYRLPSLEAANIKYYNNAGLLLERYLKAVTGQTYADLNYQSKDRQGKTPDKTDRNFKPAKAKTMSVNDLGKHAEETSAWQKLGELQKLKPGSAAYKAKLSEANYRMTQAVIGGLENAPTAEQLSRGLAVTRELASKKMMFRSMVEGTAKSKSVVGGIEQLGIMDDDRASWLEERSTGAKRAAINDERALLAQNSNTRTKTGSAQRTLGQNKRLPMSGAGSGRLETKTLHNLPKALIEEELANVAKVAESNQWTAQGYAQALLKTSARGGKKVKLMEYSPADRAIAHNEIIQLAQKNAPKVMAELMAESSTIPQEAAADFILSTESLQHLPQKIKGQASLADLWLAVKNNVLTGTKRAQALGAIERILTDSISSSTETLDTRVAKGVPLIDLKYPADHPAVAGLTDKILADKFPNHEIAEPPSIKRLVFKAEDIKPLIEQTESAAEDGFLKKTPEVLSKNTVTLKNIVRGEGKVRKQKPYKVPEGTVSFYKTVNKKGLVHRTGEIDPTTGKLAIDPKTGKPVETRIPIKEAEQGVLAQFEPSKAGVREIPGSLLGKVAVMHTPKPTGEGAKAAIEARDIAILTDKQLMQTVDMLESEGTAFDKFMAKQGFNPPPGPERLDWRRQMKGLLADEMENRRIRAASEAAVTELPNVSGTPRRAIATPIDELGDIVPRESSGTDLRNLNFKPTQPIVGEQPVANLNTPQSTADEITRAFKGLGEGIRESGKANLAEVVKKQGYVDYAKPAAQALFEKENPTWIVEELPNGVKRYRPPVDEATKILTETAKTEVVKGGKKRKAMKNAATTAAVEGETVIPTETKGAKAVKIVAKKVAKASTEGKGLKLTPTEVVALESKVAPLLETAATTGLSPAIDTSGFSTASGIQGPGYLGNVSPVERATASSAAKAAASTMGTTEGLAGVGIAPETNQMLGEGAATAGGYEPPRNPKYSVPPSETYTGPRPGSQLPVPRDEFLKSLRGKPAQMVEELPKTTTAAIDASIAAKAGSKTAEVLKKLKGLGEAGWAALPLFLALDKWIESIKLREMKTGLEYEDATAPSTKLLGLRETATKAQEDRDILRQMNLAMTGKDMGLTNNEPTQANFKPGE